MRRTRSPSMSIGAARATFGRSKVTVAVMTLVPVIGKLTLAIAVDISGAPASGELSTDARAPASGMTVTFTNGLMGMLASFSATLMGLACPGGSRMSGGAPNEPLVSGGAVFPPTEVIISCGAFGGLTVVGIARLMIGCGGVSAVTVGLVCGSKPL